MSQHCVYLPLSSLLALFVAGLVGCSGPAGLHQDATEYPTWPALEKFRGQELMMPIGTSIGRGDWDAVRALVVEDGFRAAVEEFTSTPIPQRWATPERMAAKDKTAADLKALIEAAEQKKSPKELESLWNAQSQSMSKVTKAAGT